MKDFGPLVRERRMDRELQPILQLMITKTLSCIESNRLNLTTNVTMADLDFPRSVDEMQVLLAAHVVGCRWCLAAALFREEVLTEIGCPKYKMLVRDCERELRLHSSIEAGDHFTEEAIEEYCFNRLSEQTTAAFEEHLLACGECTERLREREEFISCIRKALATKTTSLKGWVAVDVPQLGRSARIMRELHLHSA